MEFLLFVTQFIAANSSVVYGVIAALIGIFLIVIKKRIEKWMTKGLDKFFKWMKRIFASPHIVDEQTVHTDFQLQEALIELRLKTDASRAIIVQFHNGQSFTTENPIWRCSATHESVGTGVSSCLRAHQNMLASGILDLVGVFWPKGQYSGITNIDVGDDGVVIQTETDHLSYGFSRTLLQESGVQKTLKCALLNATDNIIGYVGLQYNDDSTEDQIAEAAIILHEYSLRIGYTLTGKIK